MTLKEGAYIFNQGVWYLIECVLSSGQNIVGVYCSDSQGNECFIPKSKIAKGPLCVMTS